MLGNFQHPPGSGRLRSFIASVILPGLGRRDEALAALEEGVRVYQQLAANQPGEFLPDLIAQLNSWAEVLSARKLEAEAAAARFAAMKLTQETGSLRPDIAAPCCAVSLSDVSTCRLGSAAPLIALAVVSAADARSLRDPDRQNVVYAAALVMPRSWKRACMPMRRVS
jgi:hypothetical protein